MKRLVMSVLALMVLLVTLLGAASPAAAAWDCGPYASYWGVHFTKELPAGYWSTGAHSYTYAIYNPATYNYDYYTQNFKADPVEPIYTGQAFLRFHGVMTNAGRVARIDPAQDTLFQVTYVLDPDYATAMSMRSTYAVWVRWDTGSWIQLPPSKLMKWCEISPEAPWHWTRIWDYDY